MEVLCSVVQILHLKKNPEPGLGWLSCNSVIFALILAASGAAAMQELRTKFIGYPC